MKNLFFIVGAGLVPALRRATTRVAPTVIMMFLSFANAAYAEKSIQQIAQEIGIDQHLDAQLPLDVELHNEKGEKVKLGDFFGTKPVILSLVYYRCPSLCPMTLNGLTKALNPLRFSAGKDFNMVTLSFDSQETAADALEKKQIYLKQYKNPGVEKGWHFLTGPQDSIGKILKIVGFRYSTDPASRQFAHASGVMVLTPEGKISRYFYGVEYAPKDLRFALLEAGKGKIGTLVDQILLLCYHYDPMTGRYGFAIKNALRILGALTVLILGFFVISSLRKEKVPE